EAGEVALQAGRVPGEGRRAIDDGAPGVLEAHRLRLIVVGHERVIAAREVVRRVGGERLPRPTGCALGRISRAPVDRLPDLRRVLRADANAAVARAARLEIVQR